MGGGNGGRGESDDPQLVKVSLGSSFLLPPPFQLSSLGAFFATFSSPFSLSRGGNRGGWKKGYTLGRYVRTRLCLSSS